MPIFFSIPGNAMQNGLLLDPLSVINLCQQLPLQWFSLYAILIVRKQNATGDLLLSIK